MSRQSDLIEANELGILTGKIKADFDEAVKLGIIVLPTKPIQQAQPAIQPQAPTLSQELPQDGQPSDAGLIGALESAAAIGSGLATTIAGGLGGLAVGGANALGLTDITGAQAVRGIQESLTFQPRTESGKRGLEKLGGAVESATSAANLIPSGLAGLTDLALTGSAESAANTVNESREQGSFNRAGDATLDITGSPAAATLIQNAPDFAGTIFGLRTGGAKVKQSAAKETIKDILLRKVDDPEAAIFKLQKGIITGAQRVVKDKTAQAAIKSGFDEGAAIITKVADKVDNRAFKRMVDVVRRMKSSAKDRDLLRPSDVLGNSMARLFTDVKKRNSDFGKGIDREASKLSGKQVNSQPALGGLIKDLRSLDVSFDGLQPSFAGSNFVGSNRLVTEVMSRLGGKPTALKLHKLKRFIDRQISFGKQTQSGIEASSGEMLRNVRRNINNELNSKFPDYRIENAGYSRTLEALDSFEKLAGKNVNIFKPSGASALGTLFRRISSNATSRSLLIDSVDLIKRAASKQANRQAGDLLNQKIFADALEETFKIPPKNAFKNEISKSVQAVRSPVDALKDAALEKVLKPFLPSEAKAMKAIQKLLRENANG